MIRFEFEISLSMCFWPAGTPQPVPSAGHCEFLGALLEGLHSNFICSFHLVRHRPVLEKLREEIFTITQGRRKITRTDIRRMPYLKAVLNESEYRPSQRPTPKIN